MWYFAWLLGLPLAAAFGVLNAMWYELMEDAAVATAAVKQEEASVLPAPERQERQRA
ncbi:cytochrome bd-I oxidase subunit CydX [Massilia puerhi]|uniref:cytochrome bd-I oxidase subunit CydX n=1 Tax=Massilia puerhi TaxID=2681550 RepID=UPI00135B4EEF|nr:cytochrome bd-I oxidase subunit CydX [Massilia puerhi]